MARFKTAYRYFSHDLAALIGKRVLLAAILICYATPGQAKQCARLAPPVIAVEVAEAPARFEMRASQEEITEIASRGNGSKSAAGYHNSVSGLSASTIKLGHRISYRQQTDPRTGLGCLWVDKVSVTLWVEPKVFIADELQNKECWFGSVFGHEALHVAEDRALVAKHTALIEGGLRLLYASPADYVLGPFKETQRTAHLQYVEQSTKSALGVLFKAMMAEQAERHRLIDTPHEYRAVMRKCGS